MQPDALATTAALKAAVDVGIGATKTIGLIYPQRFRIAHVDAAIDRLTRYSAEVFGKRAAALAPAS